MVPTRILFITVLAAVGVAAMERQELIMLEIQPIIYEKTIVKRSPLTQYGQEQQFVQQPAAPDAVPADYYNLLAQLQLQQGLVQQQPQQPQQPDVNNLQQTLVSRTPQTFVGQPPRPPPRRLTPEQEQQRRLQENIAQKSIREQEVRDSQRQQQAQLQNIYQQGAFQVDPAYLAQLQQAQEQYLQIPEGRQLVQGPQQGQQQYVQLSPQQTPQYVPTAQLQAEPERVSYSQVQFGTSKLPRRLTKLVPQAVQQVQPKQAQQLIYTQQPQQQVYIQPKPQQLVYTAPPQEVVYTPQPNDIYQAELRKPSGEEKQPLPQQYLIETTKVDPSQQPQLIAAPKQKTQTIYYRPQPSYQDIQSSILAQQQHAHYAQQQLEASTTLAPPSRSSIFVSTASTPELKSPFQKTIYPEFRYPKHDGQRPLTQNELNALINAGFKVTPSSPNVKQDFATYQPQFAYYRELGKRQNKPVPRPVHLTSEERRALAKEGIRNLYRVESTAESSDSPVTYVLAVSSPNKS